ALATTALYRELLPEAGAGAVLLHLEGETATLSCVREDRLLLSRSVTPERLDTETLAVEVRRTLVAGLMAGASGPAPSAVSAVWLTGAGADQALATELGRVLGDGATGRRGDGETGRRGDGESDDVNTDRGLAFDFAGSPPPPVAPSPRRPVPPGRPVRVALLPRGRLPGGEALSPSLDTALGLALLGLRPAAERLDL